MSWPSSAQVRSELRRTEYYLRFRQKLQSTLCVFATAAAAAVLAAALQFPVLQVRSDVLSPELQSGDLVLCWKTDRLREGDILVFYQGSHLLLRRCICGESDPAEFEDTDGSSGFVSREQLLGRVLLRIWPVEGFTERGI